MSTVSGYQKIVLFTSQLILCKNLSHVSHVLEYSYLVKRGFLPPNNPKILDPSYNMNLEFWNDFEIEKKKHLSAELHQTVLDIWHNWGRRWGCGGR